MYYPVIPKVASQINLRKGQWVINILESPHLNFYNQIKSLKLSFIGSSRLLEKIKSFHLIHKLEILDKQ